MQSSRVEYSLHSQQILSLLISHSYRLLTLLIRSTDEEDIFDSDFGSTDSGSGGEEDDAGEKKLEREANAERRVRPFSLPLFLTFALI